MKFKILLFSILLVAGVLVYKTNKKAVDTVASKVNQQAKILGSLDDEYFDASQTNCKLTPVNIQKVLQNIGYNITVTGIDKELVGSYTAGLRARKKPEPYKGKGMRYEGEVIRRKQGKKTV